MRERCWSDARRAYVASAGGETLDASMLLLAELGFLRADDPRFASTVDAIGRDLKRGEFVFRYVEHDDFGEPEYAFVVCTFWYVNEYYTAAGQASSTAGWQTRIASFKLPGCVAKQ